MSYDNTKRRLDTFHRTLPDTDDPAECIDHLLSWWRSMREAEAILAGNGAYDAQMDAAWNHLIAECMIEVENEAIAALLDALSEKSV